MTPPSSAPAVAGVEQQRLALEWARSQNFSSVAARHAKDCAAAYDAAIASEQRLREALYALLVVAKQDLPFWDDPSTTNGEAVMEAEAALEQP